MGDNNILPKGGFLRGVLAGLTLIVLIFIGLAVIFPLNVAKHPAPIIVVEPEIAAAQPVVTPEESSSSISVPTDAPTPTQFGVDPAVENDVPPSISIQSETGTPANVAPQIEAAPTNDIRIGGTESAPPVIAAPTVARIEAPAAIATPSVADTTQAPVVSTDISSGSGENDTTTEPQVAPQPDKPEPTPEISVEATEQPSAGLELSGQTLVSVDEPVQPDTVVRSTSDTAFDTFSATFSDDLPLPLMSVILMVNTVAEAEVLAEFSTPITLAVASENPDANDIIASYRALGGEVVLVLPSDGPNALRKGGNPLDAPAFLDASLANIEGVLGVVDGPDGDVNQDTRMISAMLAKLSETGHAIMTINGLGRNRTSILAQETGVPATDISHTINTDDGTIAVVRVLDKLVLQIGDQRSVTVFAEATPDMLFALKFWFESQKAQAVTIAPVSASILRN